MKVNVTTAGKDSPAGWYRIGVLKDLFRSENVFLNEIVPKISGYPPSETLKRPVWLVAALLERLTYIAKLRGADVTILQRELISTLPTVERLLPGKKILDVDDAIFLKKKGLAARNAAKASVGVVCGNQYLADYFSHYNKNICIIPTGVDVNRMKVDSQRLTRAGKKIVGWIGTPGNLPFFNPITPDLKAFFKDKSDVVELRIITSHIDAIPQELREFCTFVKWYPGIEFDELPKWTVGLMPLIDSDWVKGKCSFKMLQYMSAGVPVVVSPYGMNTEILSKGDIGFGPTTGAEWYQALDALVMDSSFNDSCGVQSRLLAENEYSLERVVDKWLTVFKLWL